MMVKVVIIEKIAERTVKILKMETGAIGVEKMWKNALKFEKMSTVFAKF